MAYQYLIDESAVRKIDESVQRIVDATDGLVASSPDLETANATIDGLKQLNARRKHDLIKLWDEHEELTKERDELRKDLELTRQQLQGSTRGSALATDTIFKTKKILGGGDFDSLPGVAQRVMNELARLRLEIAQLGAGRSASLIAAKEAREARDKAIAERDQARKDAKVAEHNASIHARDFYQVKVSRDNLQADYDTAKKLLEESRAECRNYTHAVAALTVDLTQALRERDEARIESGYEARRERDLAIKERDELRQALAERNALSEDWRGLSRRVRATEAQRDGALANLAAANAKVQSLEKELASLRRDYQTWHGLDSLSERNQLRYDLEEARKRITYLSALVENNQSDELTFARRARDHWQRKHDAVYRAFCRLRNQVAAAAEAPIPESK